MSIGSILATFGLTTAYASDTEPSRKSFSRSNEPIKSAPQAASQTPSHNARQGAPGGEHATSQPAVAGGYERGSFAASIQNLADQLTGKTSPEFKKRPTLISTIVDVDDLSKTSKLGRRVSEQLMYQLQSRGWSVVDLRVTRELAVKPEGDFVLSRDISKMRANLPIGNVVAGTYTDMGGGNVQLMIQVSDLGSGVILSTAQLQIVNNPIVSSLLRESRQ